MEQVDPITTDVIESYSYPVDISASLTDTDGSESLTVTIANVPAEATLSSDVFALINNDDGTWSVDVPNGSVSISDGLTLTVPEENSSFDLNISATATENSNNSEAIANDSDTLNSTDDMVTSDEGISHVEMGSSDDTITLGGDIKGSADIDMGSGDDIIHIKDDTGDGSVINGDTQMDFGSGFDSLIIEDDISFNFDNLTLEGNSYNQISNLEVIDMQNGSGNNTLDNIDLSDVLHITDDDNILRILGDSGDEIGLNTSGDDAQWTKSDEKVSEDGEEFDVWTNSSNDAKVYIDDDIVISDF